MVRIRRKVYRNSYKFWRNAIDLQRGIFLSNLPYNAPMEAIEAFLEQALDFLNICEVHWLAANDKAAGSEHSGKCYLIVKKGYPRPSAVQALEGKTFGDRTVRAVIMTDWPSAAEVAEWSSGPASAPAGPRQYTGASANPGSVPCTAPAAMIPPTPITGTEIQRAIAEIEAQEAILHAQMRLLNMRKAELQRRLGNVTVSAQPPSKPNASPAQLPSDTFTAKPSETFGGAKSDNRFDPECRPGSHYHNHTYLPGQLAKPAEQKSLENTQVLGGPHSVIGASHHLPAVPERGAENYREVHAAQPALAPRASCPYEDIWKLDATHKETAAVLEPKIVQPKRAGYPFPDWPLGASSSTEDDPRILIPHLDDCGQEAIVKRELIERETSGKSVSVPDFEPVTLSQLLHGPTAPTQGADSEGKGD